MATTNVVNLDALIPRADLAAPGELSEYIPALAITGLEPRGLLYPALRKPDFQRETANWTPEQVADLVITFVNRELIPAVILWRAGHDVFVIDGAHRLSALIAWVHNDYGDRERSRRYFHNAISEEQTKAAEKARSLVHTTIGSYEDHRTANESPTNKPAEMVERANRIGWINIPTQWIRNSDHEKAEKAFFRINQGGTKLDATERRLLISRDSPTALSARAILRAGTGHNYWNKFAPGVREKIEELGGEIFKLLYDPVLSLPIKTLDLPVAGQGYGPRALPFVFDLVNVVNKVSTKDSSSKDVSGRLPPDADGSKTVSYLIEVRRSLWRICSNHPSSLGLHPALYFYARGGSFQSAALLSYVVLMTDWNTEEFKTFTRIRSRFEEFLLRYRGITEAVRRLGSGARSRPRITALYRKIISGLDGGSTSEEIADVLRADPIFDFFVAAVSVDDLLDHEEGTFSRDVKGATFLREALPTAPKCPTCGGILHHNGMQVGHKKPRREGGSGNLNNGMIQHPFCNSTFDN